MRRRSAASASRARVWVFSFTRSSRRAASHSCGETIGGDFIAMAPFTQPVPAFGLFNNNVKYKLRRESTPDVLRSLSAWNPEVTDDAHYPAGPSLQSGTGGTRDGEPVSGCAS